jgi:hypothetical protein
VAIFCYYLPKCKNNALALKKFLSILFKDVFCILCIRLVAGGLPGVKEALFFPQMPFGRSALLDPFKKPFWEKNRSFFSTSLTPRNQSTKFF